MNMIKIGNSERTAFILLSFFMMVLFFTSCSSKPNITGKWKEIGKTATLEFFPSGHFKAVDNQGMAVSGRYILSSDGNLRCEIQHEGAEEEVVNLMIEIKGDELIVTSAGSREIERYKRGE